MRSLRRAPGFAVASVLVLAVGIGATVATFSVTDAVLFRPLPVAESDGLVRVFGAGGRPGDLSTSSFPVYEDYRDQSGAFSSFAAFGEGVPLHVSRDGERPRRLVGTLVTGSYFDVAGVEAARGRVIGPHDDAPGAEPVVVLSERTWRTLGGEPSIVGQTLRVNGHVFTVVGVLPASFYGLSLDAPPDLWLPTSAAARALPQFSEEELLRSRRFSWLDMAGRLAPGVSPAEAQARLDAVATRRAASQPEGEAEPMARVVPAADVALDPESAPKVRRLSGLLLGSTILLLLLTCADVAGLLLVRAERRREELAVRLALGAGRGRIVREMMGESLVLAGLGSAVGVVVALWGVDVLRSLVPDALVLPTGAAPGVVDGRVLAFAALLALGTAAAFGLVPAVRASGTDLVSSLKRSVPRGAGGLSRPGARDAFVAVQVALAVVLVAGALLLLRTLERAQRADLGFPVAGGLVASIDLDRQGYDEAERRRFWRDLQERLRGTPGIRAAALGRSVPVQRTGMRVSLEPEGWSPPPDTYANADFNPVSPGYLAALGTPLLRGRDFDDRDTPESPPVGIVNQALADLYWPGQDPIGKTLGDLGPLGTVEVVGLVRDARYRSLREPPTPIVYVSLAQVPMGGLTLLVRSDLDRRATEDAVAAVVAGLDPALPVFAVSTLEEHVGLSLSQERVVGALLGLFAFVAVVLAGTGLHAVVAQAMALRRRELAIRSALGSGPRRTVRLVLRRGLSLAVPGAALGLGLAVLLSRSLESLLYETSPSDPLALGGAALALGVVALLACAWPALRAARLDPAAVLREP